MWKSSILIKIRRDSKFKIEELEYEWTQTWTTEGIHNLKRFKSEGIQTWKPEGIQTKKDLNLKGFIAERIQTWRYSKLKGFKPVGIQSWKDFFHIIFRAQKGWVTEYNR